MGKNEKNDVPVVKAAGYIPAAGAQAGWQDDQKQNSQQQRLAAQGVRVVEEEVEEEEVAVAVAVVVVAELQSWYNQTAVGTEEQQWTGTW